MTPHIIGRNLECAVIGCSFVPVPAKKIIRGADLLEKAEIARIESKARSKLRAESSQRPWRRIGHTRDGGVMYFTSKIEATKGPKK